MKNILDQDYLQKRTNQKIKSEWSYAFAYLLERAAYYGLRALIVIYMIHETIGMPRAEALSVYGLLTSVIIFTRILGGLLGDLALGNQKTLLLGGILQTLGAFTLAIPSNTALFLGLGMIAIGSGFYGPNITAQFAKCYHNRNQLLDAAFTVLFIAINIGAFLGVMAIGYLSEVYSFAYGFLAVGGLMLISNILLFFVNSPRIDNPKNAPTSSRKIGIITIIVLCSGIFWGIYEIFSAEIFIMQAQLDFPIETPLGSSIWQLLNSMFLIPLLIIAFLVWSYRYSSQISKMIIGFIAFFIAIGIILLLPNESTPQHAWICVAVIFVLSIAEVYISPLVHSIITEYANPKYLATLFSIAFLPSQLISYLILQAGLDNAVLLPLAVALIGVISLGLIVYYFLSKNQSTN